MDFQNETKKGVAVAEEKGYSNLQAGLQTFICTIRAECHRHACHRAFIVNPPT